MAIYRVGVRHLWVFAIHSREYDEDWLFVDLSHMEVEVELLSKLASTRTDKNGQV